MLLARELQEGGREWRKEVFVIQLLGFSLSFHRSKVQMACMSGILKLSSPPTPLSKNRNFLRVVFLTDDSKGGGEERERERQRLNSHLGVLIRCISLGLVISGYINLKK